MDTTTETNCATNVAARVAGEDIKPGDYVTAFTEICELPSFVWMDSMGSQHRWIANCKMNIVKVKLFQTLRLDFKFRSEP